ncbi:MAG: hypothetical protein R3C26_25445 [Calditrichia bacterium]
MIEPATRSVSENVRFPTARAAIGSVVNGKMDIAWCMENGELFARIISSANTPETAAAEPDPESGKRE